MWHAWEKRGKCTGFWRKSLKERDHSENQGVDGRMGSVCMFGTVAGGGGVAVDIVGS
jgi:hypothetical protein